MADVIEGNAVEVVEAQASPPAVQQEAQPLTVLNIIAAAARDPSVDVAKLEALLRLQREVEEVEARREFNRALHEVQAKLPQVAKNGTISLRDRDGNDKGSIPFAKWEDVDAILRPIYSAHGFSLSFDTMPRPGDGGGAIIVGTLQHTAGHSRTASLPLPLDSGPGRNNLQAMGSTLSYGKRYVAEMLFNIVRKGEDRDGADPTPITEAQKGELIELQREAEADTRAFLAFLQVESLDDLPASRFGEAKNALLAKIRALKGGPPPRNAGGRR